jgi:23S rRNA pseudouridine1911/1915/1917 synthase
VGGETKYSVVEAELLTGRKHQIRAHLAELGYPILGDRLYSFDGIYYEKMSRSWSRDPSIDNSEEGLSAEDLKALGGKSQMLYAYKVEIQLPYWKESRVFDSQDYPADMAELVERAKSGV